MRNDYADQDRHGGDSLTDAGFFAVTLAACGCLGFLVWMML